MDLQKWLHFAKNKLSENSTIDSPELDAGFIAEFVCDIAISKQIFTNRTLSNIEIDKLNFLLAERMRSVPLAYILGNQPFFDIELEVNPHVLIPRPETELLVETVINLANKNNKIRIADLGTGSGAIAISLAKHLKNAQVFAVDISYQALLLAKNNARKNNVKNIQFILANWSDSFADNSFDIICSNPPYIAENDEHLQNLSYEPQNALISKNNGLADIFYLIDNTGKKLKKQGILLLEHGYNQAECIRQKITNSPEWKNLQTIKDLSNLDRIAYLEKR